MQIIGGGPRRIQLAFCGPSRSGKDEAATWLKLHTELTYKGSASQYLLPHAARALGQTEEYAWAHRHANKHEWIKIGDKLRETDPGALLVPAMQDGDMFVGPRTLGELELGRRKGLIDLFVWIDRHVPHDPTIKFGRESCDIVIENHYGVEELYAKLAPFARSYGLEVR